MSKMIQIRHVPDEVHARLKVKAAAAGMSLSDYLRGEITNSANRLTMAEFDEQVRALGPPITSGETAAETIRKVREEMREL